MGDARIGGVLSGPDKKDFSERIGADTTRDKVVPGTNCSTLLEQKQMAGHLIMARNLWLLLVF